MHRVEAFSRIDHDSVVVLVDVLTAKTTFGEFARHSHEFWLLDRNHGFYFFKIFLLGIFISQLYVRRLRGCKHRLSIRHDRIRWVDYNGLGNCCRHYCRVARFIQRLSVWIEWIRLRSRIRNVDRRWIWIFRERRKHIYWLWVRE